MNFLRKKGWLRTDINKHPLAFNSLRDRDSLDTLLWKWTPVDGFTERDAVTHIHAQGGSGSGKTSALVRLLARTWMAHGNGMLLMCPKKETRQLFEVYAAECGRSGDLIIVSPDHPQHTFNFMQYILKQQKGKGGFAVENLVQMFSHIVEIAEGKPDMGSSGDQFWSRAKTELLRAAVTLLLLAQGTMTLDDVYRLLTDAATSREQVSSEEWQANSFCARMIRQAEQKKMTHEEAHDFEIVCAYWLSLFPGMAEKTRSGIVATVSGVLNTLMLGYGHTLFSTTTTFTPEACYEGNRPKIIILDIPPETHGSTGRFLQCVFKYFWQFGMLQRDVERFPKLTLLLGDESQYWVTSQDFTFLAVARSSRVAVCYLTQNISNYYATLGANSRDSVNALLGNFGTHVFFANTDPITNKWASDLISSVSSVNYSFNAGSNTRGMSHGTGGSEAIKPKILPSAFTTLRRGGPLNNFQCDAIVVKAGGIFRATGDIFVKTTFLQK